MASELDNISTDELTNKYEEAFEGSQWNKTETSWQWKIDNAERLTNKKCAIIYKATAYSQREDGTVRPRAGYSEGASTALVMKLQEDGVNADRYKDDIAATLRGIEAGMLPEIGTDEAIAEHATRGMIVATDGLYQDNCSLTKAQFDETMENAWLDKQAEELYKLVQGDVEQAATDAKSDAQKCANDMLKLEEQLLGVIEQFWTDVSDVKVGMFPHGYDATSLRRGPTRPPEPADVIEENAEAELDALDAINAEADAAAGVSSTDPDAVIDEFSSQESEIDPEPQESVQPLTETEVAEKITGEVSTNTAHWRGSYPFPDYMVSQENSYYWDHILIDAAARKELKVPEYFGDLIGPFANDVSAFPHLYASLAIAVANSSEAIMFLMPSEDEIKSFEAGVDDSSNTLFSAAKEVAGRLKENDPTLLPPNYKSQSMTLFDVIGFVKTAAGRIPRFAPGDPSDNTKKWLINAYCDQIEQVLKLIETSADCIAAAEKAFDDDLAKIKDAINAVALNVPRLLKFLDDDDIESRARNLAGNLDDTDLDDYGYGSPSQKAIFKEQCFLLAFAAKLAAHKRYELDFSAAGTALSSTGVHKRLPYAKLPVTVQDEFAAKSGFNSSLQVSGDPFAFINKLTQTPNYGEFVNIPHYQLSALQPRIRLYKVIYDTKDGNNEEILETEVEMKFNSAFSSDELSDIFKNKRSRSAGVGLQNFEFTYDGSNPFAVKKSIKAKLSIYASTFAQLFKERQGSTMKVGSDGTLENGDAQPYRYVDLALKTLKKEPGEYTKVQEYQRILDENVGLSKLNFRLKAVVGWSLPKGKIPGMNQKQRAKLKRVISNSYVTLNLTPTIHTFNFDQAGAVNFEIDYLAYIDDFFDDRGFNVFADPSGNVGWKREMRKLQMKTYRQKCSSAEEISDLNNKYKDIVTKEINQSLSSLMRGMMDNNKIYYINLDYTKIQNFVANGPYSQYETYLLNPTGDIVTSDTERDQRLQDIINSTLAEATVTATTADGDDGESLTAEEYSAAIGASLYASSPHSTELSFFYLSDLIDVVLENIQLELDFLTKQYGSSTRKDKQTTKKPEKQPSKIDVKLWEKRLRDLQKFKNNFKRFRVLLGPVELQHHTKTNSKFVESVNLGDMPISVKYFMEWITGKVFQKDEIFYSLSTFLNQIMNNLVTNFLNNRKCFFFDIKQKVRVNQAAITSFSPPENRNGDVHVDEITQLCIKKDNEMKRLTYSGSPTRLNFSDPVVLDYMGASSVNVDTGEGMDGMRPLLNVSGRPHENDRNYAPLSHEINYMTFFASRVNATGKPNRVKDQQKGIFHYLLGKDDGILKEIKLQKTQTKGLAEARFEMDGYDGLEQLRVVYDLDIDTYANVNAFPGTYIYVPPGGLDPSWRRYNFTDTDLRSLGIGGYYMIIRSTHRFGPGEANSTIYAKWVNNLESDYPQSEGGAPASEEASDAKCTDAANTRQQEFDNS